MRYENLVKLGLVSQEAADNVFENLIKFCDWQEYATKTSSRLVDSLVFPAVRGVESVARKPGGYGSEEKATKEDLLQSVAAPEGSRRWTAGKHSSQSRDTHNAQKPQSHGSHGSRPCSSSLSLDICQAVQAATKLVRTDEYRQFEHFLPFLLMLFERIAANTLRTEDEEVAQSLARHLGDSARESTSNTNSLVPVQIFFCYYADGESACTAHRHHCRQLTCSLGAPREFHVWKRKEASGSLSSAGGGLPTWAMADRSFSSEPSGPQYGVEVLDRVMMQHGDILILETEKHGVPQQLVSSGGGTGPGSGGSSKGQGKDLQNLKKQEPRLSINIFYTTTRDLACGGVSVMARLDDLTLPAWVTKNVGIQSREHQALSPEEEADKSNSGGAKTKKRWGKAKE